jgi:Fic family protein
MKKPEPAPGFVDNSSENLKLLQKKAVQDFIARANNRYFYWDKLKHQPMPEGIPAEDAWRLVKLSRVLAQRKPIPLTDEAGSPFTYWLPNQALRHLHYIDQHAAGQMLVDEPGVHSDEKTRYMIKSIVNEAISSSQIEGASTTRVVAKEMIRSGRKPMNHSEQMIYNNYLTIRMLKDHLSEPLTPELVCTIHKGMTMKTLEDPAWEGSFRSTDRDMVEVHDRTAEQNILHLPPDAGQVAKLMDAMCAFANQDDGEDFVYPVVKAILLHFWLAWVHPFMDGNGRTARALFYWYLLKKNYWLVQYLSISTVILNARAQYDRAFLYSEADDSDLTYFIMYNLEAICSAINEFKQYMEGKQRERRMMASALGAYAWLNARQQAILAKALENPSGLFTIETHKNVHGVTHQTARTDLLKLSDAGLLRKTKQGRKFVFIPDPELLEKLGRSK